MQTQQTPTVFDFSKICIADLPEGLWYDSEVEGLTIQVVRRGLASYLLVQDEARHWLGSAKTTPLAAARAMAKKLLVPVPAPAKANSLALPAEQITLRRAYSDYREYHNLKPSTLRNYQLRIEKNAARLAGLSAH